MKRVVWTVPGEHDRERHIAYISERNPRAGLKVGNLIDAATIRLERFPLSGRPGRAAGSRELVIVGTPFVAIYRIFGDSVEVLRLLHGAQDWPHRK